MAAPFNRVFLQGSLTPISADSCNTFLQTVASVATLRTFTGVTGQTIWLQGTNTFNDGGQSLYGWSASSTAADNGTTVIAPTGSTTGRWIQQANSSGSGAFSSLSVVGAITMHGTTSLLSDGTTIALTGAFSTSGTATLGDLAVAASHTAKTVLAAPTGVAGVPTWRQLSFPDIGSLGSMAQQDSTNVAITGGTIDDTILGNSTPATGTFTNVNADSVTVGLNAFAGQININPAGLNKGSWAFTTTPFLANATATLNMAQQAGTRLITIPDPGISSSTVMLSGTALGSAGLFGPLRVPLSTCRNVDGTVIALAAAAGKFGISITAGTSAFLVSQVANTSTVTDSLSFEITLPATYIAGQNITLTVNGNYVLGGGTIGTHTLAMAAYLCADAGTQGATIIATAAQSVAASAGDMTFTITGTTLTPRCRLFFTGTMIIQDTGGSNITGNINSIRLT